MTHGFILPEDEITAVESIDTIFLAKPEEPDDPAKIPCPPSAMKLYGETDDHHLSGGYDNYRAICQALDRGGMPVQSIRRLVEFGCSNSRILRWFLPHAKEGVEVWGLDIDAKRLLWSDYTFGPHIHYALTSTQPHLPFSGAYFDFLYAGSVFTHIDSNYLSWFSELRRVLRPDGLAWITIDDETTVEILVDLKGDYFIDKMKEETEFNTFIKMNWTRFAVGTGVNRNVFYRRSWLVERIAPLFEVIDVEEKIYAGIVASRT
jgi:SAM-dependent methyltransferase